MPTGPQPEKVTGRLIAALLIAAAVILILSIIAITKVAHNIFVASYFTAESLLDASGFRCGCKHIRASSAVQQRILCCYGHRSG